MKEMSLSEIRESQIFLLDWFDGFCKANNLRYSLSCGTLLGAVRHQGYIPWDDDIDVMMPRPDYNRFMQFFADREKGREEGVVVLTPYNQNKKDRLPYTYTKLGDLKTKLIERSETKKITYHVFIDVFPIDGVPEKKRERYFRFYDRLNTVIRKLLLAKYNKRYGSFFRKTAWKIIYQVSKIIDGEKILRKMEKRLAAVDFDASDLVGNVFCGYGQKECVRREDFALTELPFEGKRYHSIKGYDAYLTSIFGDYMQLPPEEERVREHDYVASYAEA